MPWSARGQLKKYSASRTFLRSRSPSTGGSMSLTLLPACCMPSSSSARRVCSSGCECSCTNASRSSRARTGTSAACVQNESCTPAKAMPAPEKLHFRRCPQGHMHFFILSRFHRGGPHLLTKHMARGVAGETEHLIYKGLGCHDPKSWGTYLHPCMRAQSSSCGWSPRSGCSSEGTQWPACSCPA